MPVSPAMAETLSAKVVGYYYTAEEALMALTAKTLAQDMDLPDWAVRKRAQLNAYRGQVQELLHDLQAEATDGVTTAMTEAYHQGGLAALDDAARLGMATDTQVESLAGLRAIEALTAETIGNVVSTHPRILRVALDEFQKVIGEGTQAELQANLRNVVAGANVEALTGVASRREAMQRALNRFAQQGITGFVDRSGRGWSMEAYTEMATRTGCGNAIMEGHTQQLVEVGLDLVIVSDAPRECPLCREWEGKVLSISGDSKKYPSLADARAGGLQHCNCRHTVSAWQEGITPPMGETADPEGYAAGTKLRYLERKVRESKRMQSVAQSPEARKAATARLENYRAKIRHHVATTPAKRQPWRESFGVSKKQLGGTPLKVTPPKPTPKPKVRPPVKVTPPPVPTPATTAIAPTAGQLARESHTLKDVIEGKYAVGVEGRGGRDMIEAKKMGLYTVRLPQTGIFAKDQAAAADLVAYFKAGGRYGTPQMSELLGYSKEEVEAYKLFLRTYSQVPELADMPYLDLGAAKAAVKQARVRLSTLSDVELNAKVDELNAKVQDLVRLKRPLYKEERVTLIEAGDERKRLQREVDKRAKKAKEAVKAAELKAAEKAAKKAGQAPPFKPVKTMEEATRELERITGMGPGKVQFIADPREAGLPKRWGRAASEAWQVKHANQLLAELDDFFRRFPDMPRSTVANYVNSNVRRACAKRGGPSMCWNGDWSAAAQQRRIAWDASHGRPYGAYEVGDEGSGCIRHEYCHTLQTREVVADFHQATRESSAAIFDELPADATAAQKNLATWQSWYLKNVSSYNPNSPVEPMAECFIVYTSKTYVRGTLPRPIEEVFDKLVRGEYHVKGVTP